jgi:DNA-binding transcriptional regulator YdaS (Cro superfamily)
MSEQFTTGIADAIVAAGGQGALAKRLGLSQQAVSRWVKRGWVPVPHVAQVESMSGVPRARLLNPKYLALIAPVEG